MSCLNEVNSDGSNSLVVLGGSAKDRCAIIRSIIDDSKHEKAIIIRGEPRFLLCGLGISLHDEIGFACGFRAETISKAMSIGEITSLADRIPETLSSGELLRMLVAAAIASRPSLIVLDGVCGILDDSALDSFSSWHDCQWIFAGHESEVARDIKAENWSEYVRVQAYASKNHKARIKPGIVLNKILQQEHSGWKMIYIKEVAFSFKEGCLLDDPKTCTIESGCIYAVTGRNGAGKTLLLEAMSFIRKPSFGVITKLRSHSNVYVPPWPEAVIYETTLADELFSSIGSRSIVARWLQSIQCPEYLWMCDLRENRDLAKLAAILGVLVCSDCLICLDEPTVYLSSQYRSILCRAITGSISRNNAIVYASHDVHFAREILTAAAR